MKGSRDGRKNDWIYVRSAGNAAQLNATSQRKLISRRGEPSMEEKRKGVTHAELPQVHLNLFASFMPLTSGNNKQEKQLSKYDKK